MNLEPLSRWLGPRYVYTGKDIFDGETGYRMRESELFYAITTRCRELDLSVSLYDWKDVDGKRVYSYVIEDHALDDNPEAGHGPTPLSAALAAVEELTKETPDGR
jgi:hypothetical protein